MKSSMTLLVGKTWLLHALKGLALKPDLQQKMVHCFVNMSMQCVSTYRWWVSPTCRAPDFQFITSEFTPVSLGSNQSMYAELCLNAFRGWSTQYFVNILICTVDCSGALCASQCRWLELPPEARRVSECHEFQPFKVAARCVSGRCVQGPRRVASRGTSETPASTADGSAGTSVADVLLDVAADVFDVFYW